MAKERSKIPEIKEALRLRRPQTKDELLDYIKIFFGVKIASTVLNIGHQSALDYIWFAFNSDFVIPKRENADCVVWANRGGGKTETAAIVTALDVIFKPEIQIRILSGSGFQAGRMYEYFEKFIQDEFVDLIKDIKTWPTRKHIFKNGAMVEVLVQSETHVRGQHVHKLRCDEIELFKPKVQEAAQYSTMSSKGITAAIEAISTKHRPRGLMRRLVDQARKLGQPIFKWNIFDVIEKCPENRNCMKCNLYDECQGIAKKANGFYKIDDVLTQKQRSRVRSFYYEMLCEEGQKKNYGWTTSERRY